MDKLKTVMANLFHLNVEEIGESTTLENTSSWDSLRHMELILEIEKSFEIQLEADQIVAMTSYSAIMEVLISLLSKK